MSIQAVVGKLLGRAVLALLGLVIALLGAGLIVLALDPSDAVTLGTVDRLLDRAALALLGRVASLLATGLVALGLEHSDAATVSTVAAALVGLVLIAAGVWQIYGAASVCPRAIVHV